MEQQGDVLLYQTNDGGEITLQGGQIVFTGRFDTAVYLSLFGGNMEDDGRQGNPYNWWGNLSELDPSNQYRSETQNLLRGIPATSGNLRRIEDAVARDLAWLKTVKAVSSISVAVVVPALNRVKITVDIEANGQESRFEYVENWKATA